MFRTGALVFDENINEEIFTALNIPDWKETIWRESDIEDMLIHPTVEQLNRVIAVRDITTIERIRGKMTHFINTGKYGISNRVIALINERYSEIQRGILRSKYSVTQEDAGVSVETVENQRLKEQNDELAKKLEEMQKMMSKLMEEKTTEDEDVIPTEKPKRATRAKKIE